MSRVGGGIGLVLWSAALAGGLVVLDGPGGRAFPAPPVAGPSELWQWVDGSDPLLAAGGCLRLLAMALGWYLVATTALAVGTRLLGLRGAVRVVDRCSPAVVRRLAARAAGAGLAAQLVLLGAAPTLAAPGDAPVATMRALPDEPDATATMRALPDEPDAGPEAGGSAAGGAATWLVQPGEHLWRVAEVLTTLHAGRTPSDAEVDAYLRLLLEANDDRLVDPDLVFPGQELRLPPLGR